MDFQEIREWHSIFKPDNELFEIRILGNQTLSGYFYDVEETIKALAPYDDCNIYFSVNKVNDACSSRKQFNKFLQVKGSATSKNDIVQRCFLPIDIDVDRPSDICSTNEEKEYAHKKALEVFRFLKENGFCEPIVCDSSSGYHIYYPIDIPANGETEKLTKAVLAALSNVFTDDRVKIDQAVCDANRIMRLCGTWSRKGRNSEERPHRLCHILKAPKEMRRMSCEELQAFVDKYEIKKEQPQRPAYGQYNGNGEQFDLRKFISDNNIAVEREVPWDNGGTKFVLKECPFDSGHKAPDSAIFLAANGAISFKCFHSSCSQYSWRDLRLKFDPTAYDRKEREPQQQFHRNYQERRQTPSRPKYEIKEELPELGEKWLSLSNIKKIDLTKLEKVTTGFAEIDRKIIGLYMSEVTVLSGSNSSGKSSWLNTLILNIVQQNYKVALWSGELRADILKTWIQMVAAGKNNLRESRYDAGKYYVPEDVGAKIDSWLDGKFFLYNNEYGVKWEQIFNDMSSLLKVGVKIFILDNLFSLDIDLFEGDKNNKQRELILQIKEFAKKNQVHIILVAHPRKVMTFLRKNDISGTSDITNAVDNVFIMHRVNNDFNKAVAEFFGNMFASSYSNYGNVLAIEKNRMYGIVDAMCGMQYEVESRRFKNTIDECIHYGWEEQPTQQEMDYAQMPNGAAEFDDVGDMLDFGDDEDLPY